MRSSDSSTRPARRRITSSTLRDGRDDTRWWNQSEAVLRPSFHRAEPRPGRRFALRFRGGDPLDRLGWARNLIVAISLIVPAVVLWRTYSIHRASEQAARSSLMSPANRAHMQAERLRAALIDHPDNGDLLRQLAAVCADVSPAEARRCYNRLDELKLTVDKDRAGHATLLAGLHDLTGARAILNQCSPEAADTTENRLAWLELWKESADFASASKVLHDLASSGQAAIDSAIDLAEAASGSSTNGRSAVPLEVTEAIQSDLLQIISQYITTNRTGLLAVYDQRIAALPWSAARARLAAAKALQALPGATAAHQMAAVRLAHPLHLSEANHQELLQDWRAEIVNAGGLSAAEKAGVAAYLHAQHEHGLVTELIAEREAVSEPALYEARMKSLLELGLWRDAGSLASSPLAPALPRARSLVQSLVVLHRPGPRTCLAERMLTDALIESREQSYAAACYSTGCAALDHSLPLLASQAFAAAVDLSADRSSMMDSVIGTAQKRGLGISVLLRAMDGGAAFADDSVQNQVIYLHLLVGRDMDLMRSVIESRRAAHPEDTYLRFLDAFSRHQRGELAQAARLLVPLPAHRWRQGEAAVLGAIIAGGGGAGQSAGLLSRIDVTATFPEERALAEPWIARATKDSPLASSATQIRD